MLLYRVQIDYCVRYRVVAELPDREKVERDFHSIAPVIEPDERAEERFALFRILYTEVEGVEINEEEEGLEHSFRVVVEAGVRDRKVNKKELAAIMEGGVLGIYVDQEYAEGVSWQHRVKVVTQIEVVSVREEDRAGWSTGVALLGLGAAGQGLIHKLYDLWQTGREWRKKKAPMRFLSDLKELFEFAQKVYYSLKEGDHSAVGHLINEEDRLNRWNDAGLLDNNECLKIYFAFECSAPEAAQLWREAVGEVDVQVFDREVGFAWEQECSSEGYGDGYLADMDFVIEKEKFFSQIPEGIKKKFADLQERKEDEEEAEDEGEALVAERIKLAGDPATPAEVLDEICMDQDFDWTHPRVKELVVNLVKNPNTPPADIESAVDAANGFEFGPMAVYKAVLRNPNCPQKILDKLAHHDDEEVRRLVVQHGRTSL